ncbi:endonuclease/exonuclease/phosphatase family protein [Tessaracoccus massiliensis]|uniref:endonuclease/exonuclease/phosphatase family protein n=1 Tax=Tessaracoccus massiliensis TaxID=1522311 RepID=UPI00058C6098|nr:endonuclease/exonuclease/phosphatase family protein [Tessaracoccus massiliensis]
MRVLGWILLIPGALGALVLVLLRLFPATHAWHAAVIVAATFIPFLWLPATVALLGLLLVARGWLRLLAVLGLVAALVFWGRGFLPEPERDGTPDTLGLSVFMLNTQYGRADVAQVAAVVDEHDPYVLVFLEYTSGFDAALREAGLLDDFPHQVGTIREDAGGTMILGKAPLTEVERLETTPFDNIVVTTTTQTAVGEVEWTLAGIHTAPPQMGADLWAADGVAVRDLAGRHLTDRLVMVGDFNAIDQHHTMRLLTNAGMINPRSKAEGFDGWRPTWPVGKRVPPFAHIDHFLHSPGVAGWAPTAVEIDGSDHMGLVVPVPAPRS